MNTFSASIVIPAFNAERTLAKTIDACLLQTYGGIREIIVVDDGSRDHTAEIAAGFPVKYLRQENAGPAAARNQGWRAATGDIVFFTDSDCVPDNDWVEKLVALFDAPDIAAAGGTYGIMNPDKIVALSIHEEIQCRHAFLPDFVRYIGSFSLAVRRTALEAAGGFDESFRIACGEDADLTYRIAASGARMRFTRSICVKHYFPEHLARFLVQQFWRGYWIMKVMAKHPGRPGNDGYGRIRDTIQPPLASAIMLLTPLIFVPKLFALWAILNIAALAAHTPVVLFALKDRRDPRLFFLYPMLYLRSFAWALGCMRGFVAFHLLRQESPRQGGC